MNYLKISVFTLTLCCLANLAAAAEPIFTTDAGKSFALSYEKAETPIWQFNFDPAITHHPFFNPIRVCNQEDAKAASPNLTWVAPPDHVWHKGFWFAWKYINGVNYWETGRGGKAQGKTTWCDVKLEKKKDLSAVITCTLYYMPAKAFDEVLAKKVKPCDLTNPEITSRMVLLEKRKYIVAPPREDGSIQIDTEQVFTAQGKDVELNRTPLPGEPGGRAWGGYAGLSVRFAKGMTERQAMTDTGPLGKELAKTQRLKANALDYTGLFPTKDDKKGQPFGALICDNPANPHHPSPWYAIASNMSYFSPAFVCYKPYTIPKGKSLTLKYRTVFHPGRLTADQIKKEFEAYSK